MSVVHKKKKETKKNKLLNISIEHSLHRMENVVSYYLIFDRDIASWNVVWLSATNQASQPQRTTPEYSY